MSKKFGNSETAAFVNGMANNTFVQIELLIVYDVRS